MLLSSGFLVEKGMAKKREHVEVTTAIHEKDHLRRRLLHEQGGTFGVRGISVDKKTKKIISNPVVVNGNEPIDWLASKIRDIIAKKNTIAYPKNTVLIVECHPESLILEWEWNDVVDKLRNPGIEHRFAEVFLYEPVGRLTATLYPLRKD